MGMKNQVAPSSLESDTPGSQIQEELRDWLEGRLDVLGLCHPSTLSRLVLDFLRFPPLVLSDTSEEEEELEVAGSSGGDGSLRLAEPDKLEHDSELRQILVDNLMNICDQIYPVNMLVDELCLKLKKLRESCSSGGKPRHTKFTDELVDSWAAFVPEHDSVCIAFPSLQLDRHLIFQQDQRTIFDNKNKEDKINLRNAENGRVAKRCSEEIVKPATELTPLQYGAGVAFRLPTPTNMKWNGWNIDASGLTQLYCNVFNEKIEAIWQTSPPYIGNVQCLQVPMQEMWPSYVWPRTFISINDSFIQKLMADVPVIPWAKILDDDAMELKNENSSDGTSRQDSGTNMIFEECSILLNEPRNVAGHDIWSRAAAETDNSWAEFFNASTSLLVTPQGSKLQSLPLHTSMSRRSPAADREMDYVFLTENLAEPEDLLTSPRTHFRPIRDDGEWADGTTFSIDNSVERITYRRSESGRLYLPGSETPHMEYRDNSRVQSGSFVVRFRMRQHDQAVQTDFTDTESVTTKSLITDIIDSDSEDSESDSIAVLGTDSDSSTDSEIISETNSETVSDTESEKDLDCSRNEIESISARSKSRVRRRLTYDDDDSDDSPNDHPLDIEDPGVMKTIGVQQDKQENENKGGTNFDLHFPPLHGHSPSTSNRLKAVVPIHYTGNRQRTFLISGRRIKIIPIHI